MKTIEVTLKYEKSTPGTHLYSDRNNEAITSLYIKKGAMDNAPPPPEAKVTVTFPE